MKPHRVVLILTLGLILAALASINIVWATPEQSPDRQSVPTRTPKPPTPVPQPPKEHKDTPVPPTATVEPTKIPQTLPVAGIVSRTPPLGLVVAGVCLAIMGWLMRRKSVL